jgi:glutathione peroxidase
MDEFLKKENPDYAKNNDVKWNFTKFVVDKTGKVVARFEPTEDMKKLEECVEKLLA